ncbi:hypothetical protein B484DRAFT_395042 [Ochromonadaceae sp. CCMP2298]|nr:hypothetical protein B484DRAFT_395042 [Ochromonadaceae sp. CCMP2298]
MRERFLKLADILETTAFQVKPAYQQPSILVLTRSPGKFTQNKADYVRRRWDKVKYPLMLQALRDNFPAHRVDIFADTDEKLMTCPLCQVRAFHRADVVIGMHGAGLSNAMFMRPGSVLVEVVYDFDARHAPIIGIFPRLSEIIGLHHFTNYIRDTGLDVVGFANQTAAFAYNARMHSHIEV